MRARASFWILSLLLAAASSAQADAGSARLSDVTLATFDLDPSDANVPDPQAGVTAANWILGIMNSGGSSNEPGWDATRMPGDPPLAGSHEITEGSTFARSVLTPGASGDTLEAAASSTAALQNAYGSVILYFGGGTPNTFGPPLLAVAPNTGVTITGQGFVEGGKSSPDDGMHSVGVRAGLDLYTYDSNGAYLSTHVDELSLTLTSPSVQQRSDLLSLSYTNTTTEMQFLRLQGQAGLFLSVAAIPEPGGAALMLVGAGALAAARRRAAQAAAASTKQRSSAAIHARLASSLAKLASKLLRARV